MIRALDEALSYISLIAIGERLLTAGPAIFAQPGIRAFPKSAIGGCGVKRAQARGPLTFEGQSKRFKAELLSENARCKYTGRL